MLIIRFTRRGRRNDPSFRLVVTEKSNPIKGKFLEELGFYSPKLKTKSFDKERILHWIAKGAKCSPTVNNLFVTEGIIQGQKVKAWRPKKREDTKEAAAPGKTKETRPIAEQEKEESGSAEAKEETKDKQKLGPTEQTENEPNKEK